MANSLLPDLGAEQGEKKSKKAIIAEFDYDNTNSEVDGAMKTFQYRFSSKRWILSIVAYSLLLIAAVVMLIFNPTMYFVYAAVLVCLGGLFLSATAKRSMSKKVMQALDSMDPETYHCRLYEDKIEIETVICHKEDSKADDGGDDSDKPDNSDEPMMSVYDFNVGFLDFAENRESFLLVVAKKQFHCFPKRCLTEEQQEIVREHLTNKTGPLY